MIIVIKNSPDLHGTLLCREAAILAPLHNAAGLQGIQAAQEVFGDSIPQVIWAGGVCSSPNRVVGGEFTRNFTRNFT